MRFIDILGCTKEDYTIIENVRTIYQNLCKNISYDERFIYSKNARLLHSIYDREIDIEKDEDSRIVCNSINKVFLRLLNMLGIKAELIYKKSGMERLIEIDDVALVFWDENGDKYYTNLAGDIQNCKYGLQTKYFGTTKNLYEEAQDVKEIPEEELKAIDEKTGYIKSDYTDIVFKLLVEEVKNTNNFKNFLRGVGINTDNLTPDQVLETKMQYVTRLIKFHDKTAGLDEMKKFYQRLFCASILDKFESKKFSAFEYSREDEAGNVDVISCIEINLDGGPVYYMYSIQENEYQHVTVEEVEERTYGMAERRGKKLLKYQTDDREK